MKINQQIYIVIVIAAVLGLIILIIWFWSSEGNWVCQNGEWVKYGNPLSPKPSEPCRETNININVPLINKPTEEITEEKVEETITVRVFFGNKIFDPGALDCSKNFPVERTIPKTLAVGRAALEELLKGPTEDEKAQGYFTSINPGVKIQSLTIENGVAKVDFDEQLEFQVGGSCRVTAIRSQIINTLLQFPTVKEVIISINGRTEDILQP